MQKKHFVRFNNYMAYIINQYYIVKGPLNIKHEFHVLNSNNSFNMCLGKFVANSPLSYIYI